jgi:hypothetical protein
LKKPRKLEQLLMEVFRTCPTDYGNIYQRCLQRESEGAGVNGFSREQKTFNARRRHVIRIWSSEIHRGPECLQMVFCPTLYAPKYERYGGKEDEWTLRYFMELPAYRALLTFWEFPRTGEVRVRLDIFDGSVLLEEKQLSHLETLFQG